MVATVTITDEDGADSPQFGPLDRETDDVFTINEASEDLAYSSRLNLQLAENVGVKPYIPFKKSATGMSGSSAL